MTPPLVNSRCHNPLGCTCTNLRAHYQHIQPGINHQWDVTPSQGPAPDSAPANQECPLDVEHPPFQPLYPAVYTYCTKCQYIQTHWP